MSYKHYGNIGDVWKHLPLCSILEIEQPRTYVETNSASPHYLLDRSPRREYGVYTFFKRMKQSALLRKSLYTNLISKMKENQDKLTAYLGSPGLSMRILGTNSKELIYFDLEKEALNRIQEHSRMLGLQDKVKTLNTDSIMATLEMLPALNSDDLIFFDPYYPFKEGKGGNSFFDVFINSTEHQIMSIFWYCYFTLKEKHKIKKKIRESVMSNPIVDKNVKSFEILLKIIEEDSLTVNPGVLGCGLLVSNLSSRSLKTLNDQSSELVKIYRGTKLFGKYPGDLIKEIIPPKD